MVEQQQFKRNIAFKAKVGTVVSGNVVMEGERLKFVEAENKQMIRVNLIANVIDKFIQDGEKKFGSITLDDGSGQIKIKAFGEDIEKFTPYNQGDTILVIGLLRSWNNEVYITPEIIKKKDPSYLLVRKLELESDMPKQMQKSELIALKDKMINMIKDSEKDGGIGVDKIIEDLKEPPAVINQEIKKLLEEGIAYEPRPGKLRYLG